MRVAIATALMGLFVMTATAGAPISGVESQETQDVIVVFHDDVGDPAESARALTNAHGGELRFVYEHAIKGFSATLTTAAVTALERNPQVAFINENRPVEAFAQETPTGVDRIDAPEAHSNATGDGIRVAIIDTGIYSDHEDLLNVDVTSGYNCIDPGASPEDDQGHGTHVAGTVAAADNELGVIGVAPAATLIPIKVLDSSGSGTWAEVICGINHITALNSDIDDAGNPITSNDIHVANMSLGGSGSHNASDCSSPGDDALYEAICNAINSGATFVVAAGNDSTNADGFVPAAYPEVITVSAYSDTDGSTNDAGCTGFAIFVTCDEVFAPFSNYGDIVDVIAPGVNINSTTYDGGYGTKSGTSMASPHAAGVAALVLELNPDLSPAQVEAHLRDFGQCPDTFVNDDDGSTDCTDQGTWEDDPDSWTEPMAHAAYATGSSADTDSPPAVSITNPADGATVSGTVSVTADATDDDAVTQVEFFVNDTSIGTDADGSDGWGASWDTTTYADGSHTVTATATDTAGQTSSDSVSVTVDNTTVSSTMHVGDLDGTSTSQGSTWTGFVTIMVHDGSHDAVSSAKVSGSWSGSASGTVNCTTDSSGTCTVSVSGIHKRNSSVTFTVDAMSHETLTYEPADNHDPDGDSDGTSITVSKP